MFKRFGFSKPSSGFQNGKTIVDRITIDVLVNTSYQRLFYYQKVLMKVY